jgi:hypothetical protein
VLPGLALVDHPGICLAKGCVATLLLELLAGNVHAIVAALACDRHREQGEGRGCVTQRFLLGCYGLLAAVSLVACGAGSSGTIKVGAGTITVHAHNHNTYTFHVSGPNGSASGAVAASGNTGNNVALPSGFPSTVPLPDQGQRVVAFGGTNPSASSGSIGSPGLPTPFPGGPGATTYELVYKYPTQSAGSAALTAYDAKLTAAGYVEHGSFASASSGDSTVIQAWASSAWRLQISLGPTGNSPAAELMIAVTPASSQG